jgi:hypothetical protein
MFSFNTTINNTNELITKEIIENVFFFLQLPLAALYFLFFIVFVFFSLRNKNIRNIMKTMYGFTFIILVDIYVFSRIIYFIIGAFVIAITTQSGKDTLLGSATILYGFGSMFFFLAYIQFLLFWKRAKCLQMESENVLLLKLDQNNIMKDHWQLAFSVPFFIFIALGQILLSVISLYSVIKKGGTWIYGTQDLFHFVVCFGISFLSSMLGTFDGSKWTELSTSSQRKLEESKKYVVYIWHLINIRGIANLGIGIYKLTNQLPYNSLGNSILNFVFPIVFDFIPIILMGIAILAPLQNNETQ